MIKLDEKDIKEVARGRFFKEYKKYMVGYLLVLVGLLVASGLLEISYLIWGVAVILITGMILWSRKQEKAEKALVKEWKEDGNKSI